MPGRTATLSNTIKIISYVLGKFSILVLTDETTKGLKHCD
jgi:hypothetical protein